MKKTLYLVAIVFCLTSILISGCKTSTGTKKDPKTGLKVSYKGFAIKDAYLTNGTGKRLTTDTIRLDSAFNIVLTGVENFSLKNDKAYPGCEFKVIHKTGKVIGTTPDVLRDIASNGFSPDKAKTISVPVTLHSYSPFLSGATYHITARFFDKQNVKNIVTADIDVVLL